MIPIRIERLLTNTYFVVAAVFLLQHLFSFRFLDMLLRSLLSISILSYHFFVRFLLTDIVFSTIWRLCLFAFSRYTDRVYEYIQAIEIDTKAQRPKRKQRQRKRERTVCYECDNQTIPTNNNVKRSNKHSK